MWRRLPLAVAAGALLVPAAAQAKGPDRARITGPGLDHAIVLSGVGEDATGPLGALTMAGGFFDTVFGQAPDTRLGHRPSGDLGPRYLVLYRVPGPSGNSTLRQDLYPYGAGGPVTHMRSLQRFWGGLTAGGWVRSTPGKGLKSALVRAGLPQEAPTGGGGSTNHWWLAGAAGVLLLALAA